MEMEWTTNASKDASLVFWGTGSEPLIITADTSGTTQSSFPFTAPQSSDQNAAQENGADLCSANPAETAFKTWYQDLQPYSGGCGSSY